MRARLVVFPIKGRNWCFTKSVQPSLSDSSTAQQTPSTLRELWTTIFSSNPKSSTSKPELLIDFGVNKMDKAWKGLEKAPEGSFKNKIHGLGLRLLSRIKPSEMFLKSIPKDVTSVEVIYPSSLNARLVRRRLRHIAMRGSVIHKNYFYGSVTLLPLTAVFTVLPLPNIPFFWILFRTYSNWRAFKGSEKLLELVSDGSQTSKSTTVNEDERDDSVTNLKKAFSLRVLQPSKELEELLHRGQEEDGLSKCGILDICKAFDLDRNDVLKYRAST
ncbi:uncharacterized protein C23H3.12c [Ziziphus jujuba]|uniref:Uncharacterized protein C23H3.12c n=2 Tax=Ziziphus jujuba TaxID=326968 RepID=A0A6P4BQC1_ZIZJJ|nr:uncharacterized protein C23H3.12c [Ziziphus jujuba]XP_048336516.1 uncharacterized protein C23H3.12c [Ziziphus jujuba var. spinosa]KAH7546984.1 hypothetical protein FEM48_Zijuj01G0259000 [Ziziphus jujuba var. spinosa]